MTKKVKIRYVIKRQWLSLSDESIRLAIPKEIDYRYNDIFNSHYLSTDINYFYNRIIYYLTTDINYFASFE